jgi:hypothetical protein
MKKLFLITIFLIIINNVFPDDYDIVNDNWRDILFYIEGNIGDDIINNSNFWVPSRDEISTVYIMLYLNPGNRGIINSELVDKMKIHIEKNYLNNFEINFQVFYPFIVIMDNAQKNNIENKINLLNMINNELPRGFTIHYLFNTSCYGEISEINGNPRDISLFIEIIKKYFGINSIVEF